MTHVKWTALYNHWLSSAQGKDEAGGSIGEPLHVDTVFRFLYDEVSNICLFFLYY